MYVIEIQCMWLTHYVRARIVAGGYVVVVGGITRMRTMRQTWTHSYFASCFVFVLVRVSSGEGIAQYSDRLQAGR
jgi:hypothetical protein